MNLRLCVGALLLTAGTILSAAERPNVLFIAVDDLRPELGCYGAEHIISPNIDRLAASGVRFDRAYCQQAICGPSRASLMTGLRPDAIQIHGNHKHFRDFYPDIVTLPQHFKNHGWHTQSMGKIYHGVFHVGMTRNAPDTFGDPPSWSAPTFRPGPRYYYTEEGIAAAKEVYQKVYNPKNPGPDDWTNKLVFGPATEAPDVADDVLYDGQVAQRAVETLGQLAENPGQPFFLAVGFIKPHSPYIAPKKYWDLYDSEKIPMPEIAATPSGAPALAKHGSGELRRYTDQPGRGEIPLEKQRRVRHAYFACISYIDAQVGRVLDELNRLKLADNTIVVLWSDHGYHLGEHGLWGKTTNFERDTRVALIVRAPGRGKPGSSSQRPVELVDLYPTLADLSGIPVEDHLQGSSLAPLLDDPDRAWKAGAFSQYTRGKHRGYSVRDERYRFTEWVNLGTGDVVGQELYDYNSDPDETTNLADSVEPVVLESMQQLLARGEGWRREKSRTGPSELTVAPVFGDHMVLQREQPIRVWGTGRPGAPTSVSFGEEETSVTVDAKGNWSAELSAKLASEQPRKLRIESRDEVVEFEDILIGDVWICSGQSNMRWELKDCEGEPNTEIASLRILDLEGSIHPGGSRFSLMNLRESGPENFFKTDGWVRSGPETTAATSGVGFYLGSMLERELGVPIGLIENAVGGTPMEAWVAESEPDWLDSGLLPKWVEGRAQLNLTAWREHGVQPIPHHPFEPGFLFGAAIEPISKLGIRGVIWYQGESNATQDGAGSPPIDEEKNYALHARLIADWRNAFGRADLQFLITQLPGLNRNWAAFRDVQRRIAETDPNVEMAVTLDLGNPTNVHPKRKREVGERLAALALGNPGSPKIMAFESGSILRFSEPVKLAGDPALMVAGTDRKFRKTTGKLDESGLSLRLEAAPAAAVRYAWSNDPGAAIVSAASGLPLGPWRSDNWALVPKPEPALYATSFDNIRAGEFETLEVEGARWIAEAGHVEIDKAHAKSGRQCLHIFGGEERRVDLEFESEGSVIDFAAERWTSRNPFAFQILAKQENGEWKQIFDGAKTVVVGRAFLSNVRVAAPFSTTAFRFEVTSPEQSGLLIDDLRISKPKPMELGEITTRQPVFPALIGKEQNTVVTVMVNVEGQVGQAPTVEGLRISTAGTDDLADLEEVSIRFARETFGKPAKPGAEQEFVGQQLLEPGENVFEISFRLNSAANLDRRVGAACLAIKIDGEWRELDQPAKSGGKRIGYALRQTGQDGINSTRIPGLATTNEGTLITVYDNRNRGRGDLPGDIDVGMNRSVDGGQSWEPMRVIMDMGDDPEWNYDGIGDPAILVDRETGVIWVAATWSHGNRSWRGSGPGLEPEETGQLMLAKSEDDGKTWSAPINITKQVKNPDWRFVLQGPGKGITMKDGTLVFPAQYRGQNEEPIVGKPFSTLIYSKDHGETWRIGTGVKIDTTEAQLVELGDGSIMINCRDNRGGSRSVYTTTDLGETWVEHPSSRGALPEPVCMASLIRVESPKHGPLLLFSNPPQTSGRHHMTIKVSRDEGKTWPTDSHTLVDERATAYSCMTAIGEEHIGLVYEAPGELFFVRYSLDELLSKK
jgi:sialidase-1